MSIPFYKSHGSIFFCAFLFVTLSHGATLYVYRGSTNPSPPYDDWTNAAVNIQDAVNVAFSNDTVFVSNGVYDAGTTVTPGHTCLNRLIITNDITVRSVNGPLVTVIKGEEAPGGGNGSNAVRCVYMNAGLLSGFTITNGHTETTGYVDYDRSGGGICFYGGTGVAENCIISGNSAEYSGGGSKRGTLNNCIFSGNTAGSGGGSSWSILNNCVLTGNSAVHDGGGSSDGTLHNCTLTFNTAVDSGGGSSWDTLRNCIIYFNTVGSSDNNWFGSSMSYSCTTPLASGIGNITNNPILVSVSHIYTNSPCVGTGSFPVTGSDIDGEAWLSPPSIGCDEPLAPFNGAISAAPVLAEYTKSVAVGYEFSFSSVIHGEAASNLWTFGDGESVENSLYVRHKWLVPGEYEVKVTLWNDDNQGGVFATNTVHIVDGQYYVNAGNISSLLPYTNWVMAATNIQDAINEAKDVIGGTVWVTNGIYDSGTTVTPGYASLNRLVITNKITVRSVNGPDTTIIKGGEATGGGNGNDAVRCVYMNAGVLSGFTITNGHTMRFNNASYDRAGGGVNMYLSNAMVTNCIISGNSAYFGGGGCFYGTLYDCVISGNSCENGGGGSYESTLYNSVISSNSCTFSGGGNYKGTFYNCRLLNNSASQNGGGSFYGTFYNCLFLNNQATSWGGGCYYGTLNNCTLSSNSANYGGGCMYATLRNSIIYYNTAKQSGDNYYGSPSMSYSCTTPAISGIGNIAINPQFADIATGNYHLWCGSPCIDSGNNAYAPGDSDLDGQSRVWNGSVDMGVYEFVDSDGDEMPDWWESIYGGDPTNMSATADADGDGQNNGQECITGMNPINSNSYFRVTAITNSQSAEFVISWDSIVGRFYEVYWSTNLPDEFVSMETNIAYPQGSYTDTVHKLQEGGFYRLGVRLK